MSSSETVVQMIRIDKIHVQNPRTRNKGVFQGIVDNISHVGLKRPITVSRRKGTDEDKEYDLVCGQGRLEACLALGEREIPAVVIDASKEEQLLMSLIENVARRPYYATELNRHQARSPVSPDGPDDEFKDNSVPNSPVQIRQGPELDRVATGQARRGE